MKTHLNLNTVNQVPILTDLSANPRQGLSMKQFLVGQGFDLKNIFELNSFEAAIRLAQNGLGLAVLPEQTVRDAVKGGSLRKVTASNLSLAKQSTHTISMSYLSSNKEKPLFSQLLSHILRSL